MSDPTAFSIYQPECDAPGIGETIECRVIGTIETPYKKMADCPSRHNGNKHLPCLIRFSPEAAPGLVGLKAGDKAVVLYWLHLARRDMAQLPVREGVRDKPIGVFSLRTPPRPNPIAVEVVEILAIGDDTLEVIGLDCLDGTPLLDIKRTRDGLN